ncbi:hypothetical protein [Undibacterium sp. WLX3042]
MSKVTKINKDTKKQASSTPEEKKAAKEAKKSSECRYPPDTVRITALT